MAWNKGLTTAAGAVVGTVGLAAINGLFTRDAERRLPPEGRFVEVDGVRLHYAEAGKGPPLLLIHGAVMTHHDWIASGMMEALAHRFRVVAIDRPGAGYSERPRDRLWGPIEQARVLADACVALGLVRPLVVGHSFGGLVAAAIAVERPECASGLLVIAGPTMPRPRLDSTLASLSALPGVGDLLSHTVAPVIADAVWPAVTRAVFAPSPVSPSFADVPQALCTRPLQLRATAADLVEMIPAATSLAPRYSKIGVPTLILHGDGDRVVPVSHAPDFHRLVAASELRVIAGAGHMLHHATGDEVMRAIERVAARAHVSPQGS